MKTKNTRILDRFNGYTLADCDCSLCLHLSKKQGCALPECCCAEERADALAREQAAHRTS